MREVLNRLNGLLADLYQCEDGAPQYHVIMCHCVQGILAELYHRSCDNKITKIWFATCDTPETAAHDIRAYVVIHQWTLKYPI